MAPDIRCLPRHPNISAGSPDRGVVGRALVDEYLQRIVISRVPEDFVRFEHLVE